MAASPSVAHFSGGVMNEMVKRTVRPWRRIATDAQEARQCAQQRIERAGIARKKAADQMGVARTFAAGSQCERQRVDILRSLVSLEIRFGAHARRTRNHMRIPVGNDCYVSFFQPFRRKLGAAKQRDLARAVSDDMEFDRMLRAGHDFANNSSRRRRFRDPWRPRGHVEEDRSRKMHGCQDVRKRVGAHRRGSSRTNGVSRHAVLDEKSNNSD